MAATEPTDETHGRSLPRYRLLAVGALGLAPWTVLLYDGGVSLVFPWALVTVSPLGITTLPDYVFRYTRHLPQSLRAWPISTLLYACALASASSPFWFREDRRLTAGLLVLAAATHLVFSAAIANPGQLVVPVGPLLVGVVVWRLYWADLRAIVSGE